MEIRQRRRTALWISLALAGMNVVVYAPVWSSGFVSLDDNVYVDQNANIAGGLTWQSIRWALTTDRAGYWVPLTWLSHILDVELFGVSAGLHHVTNVTFHILNTVLLFALLRRITGTLWPCAFAAGLFAVHPLRVESVAWIAERKGLLSALLWILAIWAYAAYVDRPGPRRYAAVMLLFAMALMAKPMVVTLPFVLVLLDLWPLRRARLERGQGRVWARLAIEKLPLLALAIAASALTIAFHQKKGGIGDLEVFPLSLRAANAVVSYAAYIGDTIWPAGLAPFYPYVPLSGLQVSASLLVLIAASVLAIRQARTRPYLLVGWLWYVGTLSPAIGLIQAGQQSRADRFTYLPLAGLFIIAAWGIPDLLRRWRHRDAVLAVAAAAAICASVFAARIQVQYWENRFTLWGRALEVTERNYVAHNVVGLALADSGRFDEAIGHYTAALTIRPDYAQARNNLGVALGNQGKIGEAISEFRIASGGRSDAQMFYNLGFALAQQGKLDEAVAQYEAALSIDPADVAVHTKLGDALLLQGKLDEAIDRYRQALSIQPHFALAHNNLAVAVMRLDRFEEAVDHFTEALRLEPDFVEAHNGLGAALANQGRYDEAIGQFEEALRLEPDHADARQNLTSAIGLKRAQ